MKKLLMIGMILGGLTIYGCKQEKDSSGVPTDNSDNVDKHQTMGIKKANDDSEADSVKNLKTD